MKKKRKKRGLVGFIFQRDGSCMVERDTGNAKSSGHLYDLGI